MPKISNKRKATMLLDQLDELLQSGNLRPGEKRRWQAWRRRIAATLEPGPTTTNGSDDSTPWERLAFDALRQAAVLENRVDDRATEPTASKSTRSTPEQATADASECPTKVVERAPAVVPITVTIPAKTITVSSPLHLEILRLVSLEGLSRSWRIAQRVLAAGLAENENSVRNALRRLTAMGLIDDYRERGKTVGWSPMRGGSRRLVLLTETSSTWCTAVFGHAPAASELVRVLQQHQSVQHGVAVLEARDYLRKEGYGVDERPQAILATEGEQWGKRTEPDLMIEMEGQLWPVEVQRKVSNRVTAKWEKCIALAGRLALVLLSNSHLTLQRSILLSASLNRRSHLLGIRLASLEDMQHDEWRWYVLRK